MTEALATRDRILHFLRRQGSARAQTLASEVGVTLSAVRQHLASLEREGLIEAKAHKKGQGRPAHHYFLTAKAEAFFDKRYDSVALDLLDAIVDVGGKGSLASILERRRQTMVERYASELEGLSFEEKMQKMAQFQREQGFMARVEEQPGQLVLKEDNCPFIEVARKYPEFCEVERRAYEELLGREVELVVCRASGDRCCSFCVASPSSEGGGCG